MNVIPNECEGPHINTTITLGVSSVINYRLGGSSLRSE